jgi:hypothetical protein
MDLGGPQAVKVLSPEILYLRDCAEVFFITEGNTLHCANGERCGGTRGRRGRFALDDLS